MTTLTTKATLATFAAALAVAAVCAAGTALAGDRCKTRPGALEVLEREYGETHVSSAVDGGGQLIDITLNRQTGTWTILITLLPVEGHPAPPTCVATHGDGWRDIKQVASGPET